MADHRCPNHTWEDVDAQWERAISVLRGQGRDGPADMLEDARPREQAWRARCRCAIFNAGVDPRDCPIHHCSADGAAHGFRFGGVV